MPNLNESLRLDQRSTDGNGDADGPFVEVATMAAEILPLGGGQAVMDQRLQGKQPYSITVRSTSVTRQVDNSWRLVNARSGVVYFVTAANQSQDRIWMTILAVQKIGQANG